MLPSAPSGPRPTATQLANGRHRGSGNYDEDIPIFEDTLRPEAAEAQQRSDLISFSDMGRPSRKKTSTSGPSSSDSSSIGGAVKGKLATMKNSAEFTEYFDSIDEVEQSEVALTLFNYYLRQQEAGKMASVSVSGSGHVVPDFASLIPIPKNSPNSKPLLDFRTNSNNNTSNSISVAKHSGADTFAHSDNVGHGMSMVSIQIARNERVRQRSVDGWGYEVLNEYTLLDEIGSGASGRVMLALHSTTQEPFAVKAVPKTKKLKFGRALPGVDIEKEVALMKNLRHPNIVKLHEVIDDSEDQTLHLVMDYIPNGPLLNVRTNNGVVSCEPIRNMDRVLDVASQVASGLRYLHKRNIVHKDIKPDNLLVGADENVFITDFGVSEKVSHGSPAGSPTGKSGGVQGTPAFLAPEQCRGEQLTPAADVWAFGITLYLAIFGVVPFVGKGTVPTIVDDILHADLHFPDSPSLSKEWKECITKLLDKDPRKRMTLKAFLNHKVFEDVGSASLSQSVAKRSMEDEEDDQSAAAIVEDDIFNKTFTSISARNGERIAVMTRRSALKLEDKAEALMSKFRHGTGEATIFPLGRSINNQPTLGGKDAENCSFSLESLDPESPKRVS